MDRTILGLIVAIVIIFAVVLAYVSLSTPSYPQVNNISMPDIPVKSYSGVGIVVNYPQGWTAVNIVNKSSNKTDLYFVEGSVDNESAIRFDELNVVTIDYKGKMKPLDQIAPELVKKLKEEPQIENLQVKGFYVQNGQRAFEYTYTDKNTGRNYRVVWMQKSSKTFKITCGSVPGAPDLSTYFDVIISTFKIS